MRIGAHVSSSDPLEAAASRGADVVQVFLSPPQSYKKPLERDDADELAASPVPVYVHAPYIINVATTVNRIRHPSRSNLEQTVRAGEAIGAAGVIVHGGHVTDEDDPAEGFGHWRTTLDRLETEVPILVENTAGGGNAMARTIDAMLGLFEALDGTDTPYGLCLDTCHLWAGAQELVDGARRLLDGVGAIDLVHLNDSRDPFGSGRDRHTNLGDGEIDEEALVEVVRMADADVVVETPGEVDDHRRDLEWIRSRL